MPDISFQNLRKIPEIQQTGSMQQNGPNNCGAYAVIAAVGAFEVFPTKENLSYAIAEQGPPVVAIARNARVC